MKSFIGSFYRWWVFSAIVAAVGWFFSPSKGDWTSLAMLVVMVSPVALIMVLLCLMKKLLKFGPHVKQPVQSATSSSKSVEANQGKDASSELVSLGQNNPEVILDFSQAVIVETPELTDYAEEWREAPPEWWKLINEASNAYSRKKYIVVRDLLNEAKSIAPLDYRAKPLLFRALRKLTDPKLVRRLSVEVLSELSVGVE